MMTPARSMDTSIAEHQAVRQSAELENVVAGVEQQLAALAESLRERDAPAIEFSANELQRALSRAVERFMQAARQGGVPEPMRRRLARASGQVAAQREVLSRATAALDRAIDVLMPGANVPGTALYGASGLHEALQRNGSLSA